jgi:hypothetical protein
MEKWIPPVVIALILLLIFWPPFMLILLSLALFYYLTLLYFNHRIPPPYLSVTTDAEIVINWFTKETVYSAILLKGNADTCPIFPESRVVNEITGYLAINSAIIRNLPKNQNFLYEIVQVPSDSAQNSDLILNSASLKRLFSGKAYYFRTPSQDGLTNLDGEQKLTVIAFGDMQPKSKIPPLLQWWIMRKVARQHPDLLFFLGDHTMEGIDPLGWRQFYHILGLVAAHTPVLGVPGNHDTGLKRKGGLRKVHDSYLTYVNYPGEKSRYFVQLYGLQIFAFDFESGFGLESPNYRLLRENINKIHEDHWLITLWHSSPHNSVKVGEDVLDLRRNFVPVLNEKGCRLWLGGHEHSYQRFKVEDTYFLTSAATSSFHRHRANDEFLENLIMQFHFLKLSLDPSKILIEAISLTNQVLDIVQIEKAPKPAK